MIDGTSSQGDSPSVSITAHNLYIGSAVTSLTSVGPVLIQSGSTYVNNKNSVNISGEFEVALGATFEINSD